MNLVNYKLRKFTHTHLVNQYLSDLLVTGTGDLRNRTLNIGTQSSYLHRIIK